MREHWVDSVKGVAIYLMVLGHCIQYASHDGYIFGDNFMFKLIYSFHMPLFMLISGYLFWYSLSKYSLVKGFQAKLKGIMIPCLAWGMVTYLIDVVVNNWSPVSVYGYLYYTAYSNWFLWAVFYCSLVGLCAKFLFKGNVIGYLMILVCNYFIPRVANIGGAKRLMPFFILGLILNQYKVLEKLQEVKHKLIVFLGLCIAYIASMVIAPDVELITGTTGSLLICFVFWVMSSRYRFTWIENIGKVSIGIYLSTGIVFYFVIKEYCRISESYRYLIRAGYVVGLSIGLTVLAYWLCIVLGKCKITSILFLGREAKGSIKKE